MRSPHFTDEELASALSTGNPVVSRLVAYYKDRLAYSRDYASRHREHIKNELAELARLRAEKAAIGEHHRALAEIREG